MDESLNKRILEIDNEILRLQNERDSLYAADFEDLKKEYQSYCGRTYYSPKHQTYYRVIDVAGYLREEIVFNCLYFSNQECWNCTTSRAGTHSSLNLNDNSFYSVFESVEDLKKMEEISFLDFKEAFDENCKRLLNLPDLV